MSKYSIKWAEEVTSSTGKKYTKAKVTDEQGVEHDVSIWPDFPDYAKIVEGEVEGVITVKGAYKNLVAGNLGAKTGGFQRKENQISKSMDRKEASIKRSMETKELGIMTSASMRDAVNIALAQFEGKSFTAEEMKTAIEFWRDYLISNFHIDLKDYQDPLKD